MDEGLEHRAANSIQFTGQIRQRVEVRSPRGSIYWRNYLKILCDFVEDQCKKTLEIADARPIWNKDPFIHIKRDVGAPTAQLD